MNPFAYSRAPDPQRAISLVASDPQARERVLLAADPPAQTVGGPLVRRAVPPPPRPRRTRGDGEPRDPRPAKDATLNPFSR